MIELVFAIVIMALAVITIPTIIMSNARNVETNLLQEAVLMATAQMGQTLSYQWDDNSSLNTTLAKTEALDIGNPGDSELFRVNFDFFYNNGDINASDFRRGHFLEPLHRRMSPPYGAEVRTASAVLGQDGAEAAMDDVDDIADYSQTLTETDEFGYKGTYRITGGAAYVSDAATYSNNNIAFNFNPGAVAISNIKMITINVEKQDSAGNFQPVVLLRSFAANIGETDFYHREF
jgi:hypothetical protein